jgi:hypothetical protein
VPGVTSYVERLKRDLSDSLKECASS